MFGLIKGKKRQAAVKHLTAATEDALSNMFADMTGNDTLLARLGVGRQHAFDAVYADDEVAACTEDLRAAMLAKPWRLYGDGLSEEDKDRLWKMLRQHMGVLAETVIDARLNGYSVARYVYAQGDDGIRIANVSSKRGELERFVPYRDGSLMYRGTAGEEVCDTNVMYLFLTHRATSTNPAGEMAAARLYAPVALRSKGFVFAAQFITRYAQPYMVAKINAGTDEEHRGFMRRFIDFLGGGAVSIEREDDVKMLQNTADGQAFKRLENLAKGNGYPLSIDHLDPATVSVKNAAGQAVKAEHLSVNAVLGLITVLPPCDNVNAGEKIKVTAKTLKKGGFKIDADAVPDYDLEIMLDGENRVTGEPVKLHIPSAVVAADSELDWFKDDFNEVSFTGNPVLLPGYESSYSVKVFDK